VPRLDVVRVDEGGLATIAGTVPELIDLPAGCPFAGRCSHTADRCHTERPEPTLIARDADGDHVVHCLRREVIDAALPASAARISTVAA
jgi:peptide/nickel transport system ATP-binding protein